MSEVTQAQLIQKVNWRFRRSGFEVEKIRVFYKNAREVTFDVYIDGFANQISGSFHRTSRERNVDFSKSIPCWLQRKVDKFLNAVSDMLSDLFIYDELLRWNEIPEK